MARHASFAPICHLTWRKITSAITRVWTVSKAFPSRILRSWISMPHRLHHLDGGGAGDDQKQDWQEKENHRHGQFRRQGSRLFFRRGHAGVAAFPRQHTQTDGNRGAVLLGLLQGGAE